MAESSLALSPPWLVLEPLVIQWLQEDMGRGDRTTAALDLGDRRGRATLTVKQAGVVAGLPIAAKVFQLLDATAQMVVHFPDGTDCSAGAIAAEIEASLEAILLGERVALNVIMALSGIASLTRTYAQEIADLATQLVDTRKTTPGFRLLEKYATALGGARNHRFGLDDAVMIKDNHILAAGSLTRAVQRVRRSIPLTHTVEVETETLDQVKEALGAGVNIIMLDNMPIERINAAVELIRRHSTAIKIEASGNITLETLRTVALTGVDYISTSGTITRAPWLDWSLTVVPLEELEQSQ
ncbi:carboxylating nicotinate-nucleotide diphosphorylase [Candidatus Synechococcus calcipolaris G9]|uniref:nicotinate-nucleotide diphosphorylase (carboxylating) n=1 Tax=Candidatus Synechococcus calcipolaris G9 TaxID=1497997 RepID=A0ABT6EWP8_9SYNE|nr:carboxylating nicotinate-nucleotide diphosphorylase [Candidatus Synechococcus calcipolaris]MDG2989330.1 carboxylating nicotinate-nucleotide diphosphorylase [Candidatus Synechococcus calcipolaris G9]